MRSKIKGNFVFRDLDISFNRNILLYIPMVESKEKEEYRLWTKIVSLIVDAMDCLLEDWWVAQTCRGNNFSAFSSLNKSLRRANNYITEFQWPFHCRYPSLGTRFVHSSQGELLVKRIVLCPSCSPFAIRQRQTRDDSHTSHELTDNGGSRMKWVSIHRFKWLLTWTVSISNLFTEVDQRLSMNSPLSIPPPSPLSPLKSAWKPRGFEIRRSEWRENPHLEVSTLIEVLNV